MDAAEANTVPYTSTDRRPAGRRSHSRPDGYGNYQRLRPGSRTLRLRDAGDDVKYLQRHIGAEPDGCFGPETARALAEFRGGRGLGDLEEPAGSDLVGVVVGHDVWATILGGRSALPSTRRRWRLGGDPRMTRR